MTCVLLTNKLLLSIFDASEHTFTNFLDATCCNYTYSTRIITQYNSNAYSIPVSDHHRGPWYQISLLVPIHSQHPQFPKHAKIG